jgi:excisionase family DNA binding protein
MPDQPPMVLTVAEAARALQVSQASIRAAIGRGELPAFRLGRRVLLPRTGLEQVVSGSRRES